LDDYEPLRTTDEDVHASEFWGPQGMEKGKRDRGNWQQVVSTATHC